MNITDYIKALKDMKDQYGDLPVVDENGVDLAYPEFNEDDGIPVIVACEKR